MTVFDTLRAKYYYSRIRNAKQWGWFSWDPDDDVLDALHEVGIETQEMSITPSEYRTYFEKAEYRMRYPEYYPENLHEKSLEHFIAQELLQFTPDDVYIDIASQKSPAFRIYERLYGCRTYAQDLSYEPGIHGRRIGSSAESLPVPDAFATKLALHCSFEHFEGDSDIGFVREAARVLQVGGAFVIVPLYLSLRYSIVTDILCSGPQQTRFESDAKIFAVRGWGNCHSRFYDAAHLHKRIIQNASGLQIKIIYIKNRSDIHSSCYARFALLARRL